MKKLFTLALMTALALTGCTIGDIKDDVDNLKKRVTTLEGTVESLKAGLEDGMLIKSVNALPDGSGYRIEFSGGASRADSYIDILHGDDGNHGVTPKIEVRTNADGTVSVWHNCVAGYPETGWVNTGIDLSASGGVAPKIEVRTNANGTSTIWYNVTAGYPVSGWTSTTTEIAAGGSQFISIVDNGSSVTFTMNDNKSPHDAYTFWKASTVSRIEIMHHPFSILVGSGIVIPGGGTGRMTIRVNPSDAFVPVGTGDAIANWQLDQMYDLTRSYVTTPDFLSIQSVLPSGDDREGEYTVTIENNNADDEYFYQMALVLNIASAADPVLVTSSPFAVEATEDLTVAPDEEYFGTWDHSGTEVATFTADKLTVTDPDGDGYTIAIERWMPVDNDDPETWDEYPLGYRIIGTLEHVAGVYVRETDADGDGDRDGFTDVVGTMVEDIWFISTDKSSLVWIDPYNNVKYPFVKQISRENYYGNWFGQEYGLYCVVDEDSIEIEFPGVLGTMTISGLTWTPDGGDPEGYSVEGTVTSATGEVAVVDGETLTLSAAVDASGWSLEVNTPFGNDTFDKIKSNTLIINGTVVEITGGVIDYYADYYSEHTDAENIYVGLYDAEEDWKVWLDALVPAGETTLLAGTYTYNDSFEEFTLTPSSTSVEDANGDDYYISSGTAVVTVEGSGAGAVYTIEMDFTLEGGGKVRGTFKNRMRWEDESDY